MISLRHGQAIVLDVESHRIAESVADPPLVCAGMHGLWPLPWWILATPTKALHVTDPALGFEQFGRISSHAQSQSWNLSPEALSAWLGSLFESCNLITHRGCFDLGVIVRTYPELRGAILDCLLRGGVYDTRIAAARSRGAKNPEYASLNVNHRAIQNTGWRDQLPDRGRELGLAELSASLGGPQLKKGLGAQFKELESVSVDAWPVDAITYCISDLSATGWCQVQQALTPIAESELVIDPAGWIAGLITPEIFEMHLQFAEDCRAGKAIAWRKL